MKCQAITAKLNPIQITTRPLSDANAALDSMRRGETVGRVVMQP